MSFAYLPWYTGDYRRDTLHLTPEEHGIYLLLLAHCWDQKGPVPLDERRLCGIVNARSGGEIESLRRVLDEFFVRMDDGFYNRRMQAEIERSEAISDARSSAGKKGYQAKAKHLLSKRKTSAQQVPLSPPPSPSLSPTPTPKRSPPPQEEVVAGADAPPPCPYRKIVDLYHECCQTLPRCAALSATRQAHIQARWRHVWSDEVPRLSQAELVEWFREFFSAVAASTFLTGRARGDPNRKPFKADLAWLMRPENFLKVVEGRYNDPAKAAA